MINPRLQRMMQRYEVEAIKKPAVTQAFLLAAFRSLPLPLVQSYTPFEYSVAFQSPMQWHSH
jgi:hypothetical protein